MQAKEKNKFGCSLKMVANESLYRMHMVYLQHLAAMAVYYNLSKAIKEICCDLFKN